MNAFYFLKDLYKYIESIITAQDSFQALNNIHRVLMIRRGGSYSYKLINKSNKDLLSIIYNQRRT